MAPTRDAAATALLGRCGDAALAAYDALVAYLATLGPVEAETKKTSIHLVHSTGFAGVHPRSGAFVLNVRLARPLESGRLAKSEQVSKSRWHHELRIEDGDDLDDEVRGWLREAYALTGP